MQSSLGGCERYTAKSVSTLLALFFAEGKHHHRQQPVRLQLLYQCLPLAPAVNDANNDQVRMCIIQARGSGICTAGRLLKVYARPKMARHFSKLEIFHGYATDSCKIRRSLAPQKEASMITTSITFVHRVLQKHTVTCS